MAKLTAKQERFVDEYLVDLNATAAAKRAGYKDPNIGRQLITKNDVSAAIRVRREELQSKLEISQEAVLQELASVAFANGTDFITVTEAGLLCVKPTSDVPKNKLPAIAGIKYNQLGIEIKLHDKVRALELLGKHLGVFDSRNDGKPQGAENNLLKAIMGAGEVDTDDLPEVE